MKGKIIFFAGIFMVASGLPLTLFAMHIIGEMTVDLFSTSVSGMHVFPEEPFVHRTVLSYREPIIIETSLDPEGIPINIIIINQHNQYEILNESISSNQLFTTDQSVPRMEFDITLTNLGSKPVWVDVDFYDENRDEQRSLQKMYSRIVIPLYYLFFFGGIATIGVGGILWRKRK